MKTRKLTTCAIIIALACVASVIKLYRFPFGGSVTLLSMLLISLPAWIYGTRTGIVSGLCYGIIQFALGPTFISLPQFFLDYILAFSIMGLGGIFKDSSHSLIKCYVTAAISRWAAATLAGLAWVAAGSTVWDGWNPILYSMAYNGAYISAEAILTLAIVSLPQMKNMLGYLKEKALV